MKLVLIDWIDSHSPRDNGWRPVEDLAEEGSVPLKCRSVGWLASDRNKHKVLVPHVSGVDQDVAPFGFGAITIPDVAIIRMRVLTR